MNYKYILITVFSVFVFLEIGSVQAQESLDNSKVVSSLVADIESESSVESGRNIIFSAKNTLNVTEEEVVEYLWQFGDGKISSKEEVVHIYDTPGLYLVRLEVRVRDIRNGGFITSEMTKEVFVYQRAIVILTDVSPKKERIDALVVSAEDENVYLRIIDAHPDGLSKQAVSPLVEDNIDIIRDTNVIVLWADEIEVLNALNRLRGRVSFLNKDIVVISEGSLGVVKTVMKGVFGVLNPHRMILTRREAIDELFTTEGDSDILDVIVSRGYDFELLTEEIVSKKSIWDFPSLGIRFLQQRGISDVALVYVLLLGVIVTIVAFLKLMVGLSSVGLRIPVVVTYLFLVMGVKVAFAITLLLMIFAYGVQRLIGKKYLLHTAKVALVVSLLALFLLFLIGVLLYFNLYEFDLSSVLAMIVVGVLMERMVSVEAEHGIWATVRLLGESLLVTLITYMVVSSSGFQLLLLARPEILILFVMANLLMGRFTGLRLMEYFRFREVLRFTEEE